MSANPGHEAEETFAPRLSTPRAAGVAGIVFAACFTATILLTSPSVSLSASRFSRDLSGPLQDNASIVASYLVPFAGIAFLWFIGVMRERIGVHEDKLFASVFLGSGLLFVAMLFGAASVLGGLLTLSAPTDATLDLGRSIARAMLYLYGARSAGVFMLVTSTIVLRTKALPKWAAYVGYAIGLVLLLVIKSYALTILLFPAWVALLSALILLYVRPVAPATGPLQQGRAADNSHV